MLLEIADFEDFEFNSVPFSKHRLHNRFHRCALENLLVSIELAAGREVLNRFATIEDKATRKLSKIFPDAPREKIHQAMQELFSEKKTT